MCLQVQRILVTGRIPSVKVDMDVPFHAFTVSYSWRLEGSGTAGHIAAHVYRLFSQTEMEHNYSLIIKQKNQPRNTMLTVQCSPSRV